MIAKAYLELCKMTCQFHLYEPGMGIPTDRLCGKPVVAVYVSDDDRHLGTYVCQQHAESAERDGDGPVFWQKREVVEGEPETGELRIHLAE